MRTAAAPPDYGRNTFIYAVLLALPLTRQRRIFYSLTCRLSTSRRPAALLRRFIIHSTLFGVLFGHYPRISRPLPFVSVFYSPRLRPVRVRFDEPEMSTCMPCAITVMFEILFALENFIYSTHIFPCSDARHLCSSVSRASRKRCAADTAMAWPDSASMVPRAGPSRRLALHYSKRN